MAASRSEWLGLKFHSLKDDRFRAWKNSNKTAGEIACTNAVPLVIVQYWCNRIIVLTRFEQEHMALLNSQKHERDFCYIFMYIVIKSIAV